MSADHKKTFSSVDAAWLHMDSPTNLAIITGVMTFQGKVSIDRLKSTLGRRMLTFDRFKQRVREPAFGLGLPQWEDDPDFNIDNHVIQIELPEPRDHAALQDLVGEMISQPLDRCRPLWKFYLTEMASGDSALIGRLHHCIADGLALVQVLLSTTDTRPDAEEIPEEPPKDHHGERGMLNRLVGRAKRAAHLVERTWDLTGSLAHEGMQTLVHPSRLVQAAHFGASATRSLAKLVLIPPDRRTVLRGRCGKAKRAVWSVAIDLEEAKAIGHLMGGTVNDVLLSALTGALRRYLEMRQNPVHGLNIRGIVPVSLRPENDLEKLGNQFGLVFLSLPVGVEDPLKRLVVLKRRMNAIKNSPEALVAFGILGTIGLTPTQIEHIIVAIFGLKGTAVLTNVPGPRQPLYYAGRMIDTLMFWVPTPANQALGVSIISYNGRVIMGVATDAGLIPDPENILACFIEELEFLKRWGRPPKKDELATEKRVAAPETMVERGGPETAVIEEQADLFQPLVISQTEVEEPPARKRAARKKPAQPAAAIAAVTGAEAVAVAEAEPSQCQAVTRSGNRCKNRALPGSTVCGIHRERKPDEI